MLDLDSFIAECRAGLTQPSPEMLIKEILERAVANPSGVEAALGTPRRATITTLHHDRDLTILNVVWTPGMAAYPHDHRMWALIGLYGGREDNTLYRRSAEGLQVAGGRQLETGDTALLGESVIHAVVNPLRVLTGAIHIYGGDFFGTPRSELGPGDPAGAAVRRRASPEDRHGRQRAMVRRMREGRRLPIGGDWVSFRSPDFLSRTLLLAGDADEAPRPGQSHHLGGAPGMFRPRLCRPRAEPHRYCDAESHICVSLSASGGCASVSLHMAPAGEPNAWKALGELSTIGIALVVATVIGLAGGYYLDRWLGTSPWLTLVGLLFGIAAGFVNLFRSVKRAERNVDDSE